MCICVPMPWPVYSRTIPYGPAARAACSTAWEISESRRPGTAWASPCQSACSQALSRPDGSATPGPAPTAAVPPAAWPTRTVTAESPCQPPTMAPQSMEITSPSCSIWPRAGDAVHDLVVDRRADRRRIAVVALEGGNGARQLDLPLRYRVELGRADPRRHGGYRGLQRCCRDQPGLAHDRDLGRGLDLDRLVPS